MHVCRCTEKHRTGKVVLTGGPGAGKTAILEFMTLAFCRHVVILPESAGILFGGGFPRNGMNVRRRAAQRAIFRVQRELEAGTVEDNAAIVATMLSDGIHQLPPVAVSLHRTLTTLHRR